MADEPKKKPNVNLVSNKRARSVVFMVISFIIILLINGMLPIIEGNSHYTVGTTQYTYGEYKQLHASDEHYNLTWATEQKIDSYIERYIEDNPELSEEEKVTVEVPSNFKVNVNTKFFFEYPFWYVSTVVALASAVLLFYSLFNFLVVTAKDKYKKYVDLEADVDGLTDKELDPDTFEPWTENVFNRRRKIAQHEGNIKYKMQKLEDKTKYKHKKRFKKYFLCTNDDDKIDILNAFSYLKERRFSKKTKEIDGLTRKERKYLNRREYLLTLLEPQYISTYVVNSSVKYFKYIHSMFVYNGTNIIGKTVDGYSMISSDSSKIKSDAGAKVFLSLSITLVFSTLLTITAVSSAEQSTMWIGINILAKIAPLLLQVPLAYDYNNSFMSKQLIPNLLARRNIGLLYMADMKKGVEVYPVEVEYEQEVTPDIIGSINPKIILKEA